MSMPTLCSFVVTMKVGRHALKLLCQGEKNSPLYSEEKGLEVVSKKSGPLERSQKGTGKLAFLDSQLAQVVTWNDLGEDPPVLVQV